jgi:hypothetical protein
MINNNNEKISFDENELLQPTINIGYGWRNIRKMVEGLTWRIDDELTHREFHKVKGGYFGKNDWITKKKLDDLEELQRVFIECRRVIKPHSIYDDKVNN